MKNPCVYILASKRNGTLYTGVTSDLADRVNMSVSSFHHHFKSVTAMTPVQYQKQLRLHEARRLMLVERLDAGTAGHRVGYQSPSQFSREYSRLYGASPSRDVDGAREVMAAAE